MQSKQAEHVLVYNQKVMDRDRELKRELELTKSTQEEMVNRLALYQRLIKQLNERIATEVRTVSVWNCGFLIFSDFPGGTE